MKRIISIAFIMLYFAMPSFSQADTLDYNAIKLPSLEELFEGARRNPTVRFYSYKMDEQEKEIKSVRRAWLKHLKFNATTQYGVMSMNSFLNAGVDIPIINQTSGSAQLFYNVGFSFNLPFDEIFDRRNRIKKQYAVLSQTEMEIERWYDEQKIKIIETYTTAKKSIEAIKYKYEAAALATAQYQISEKEFIMGKIEAAELNNSKGIASKAHVDLEEERAILINALLRLEVLANYKIINK